MADKQSGGGGHGGGFNPMSIANGAVTVAVTPIFILIGAAVLLLVVAGLVFMVSGLARSPAGPKVVDAFEAVRVEAVDTAWPYMGDVWTAATGITFTKTVTSPVEAGTQPGDIPPAVVPTSPPPATPVNVVSSPYSEEAQRYWLGVNSEGKMLPWGADFKRAYELAVKAQDVARSKGQNDLLAEALLRVMDLKCKADWDEMTDQSVLSSFQYADRGIAAARRLLNECNGLMFRAYVYDRHWRFVKWVGDGASLDESRAGEVLAGFSLVIGRKLEGDGRRDKDNDTYAVGYVGVPDAGLSIELPFPIKVKTLNAVFGENESFDDRDKWGPGRTLQVPGDLIVPIEGSGKSPESFSPEALLAEAGQFAVSSLPTSRPEIPTGCSEYVLVTGDNLAVTQTPGGPQVSTLTRAGTWSGTGLVHVCEASGSFLRIGPNTGELARWVDNSAGVFAPVNR